MSLREKLRGEFGDGVLLGVIVGLSVALLLDLAALFKEAQANAPPTAEAFCPDQPDAIPLERADSGVWCISEATAAAYLSDSVKAAKGEDDGAVR